MPTNFPTMAEEDMLERLRKKDEAIEELVKTVTSLKKELLDIHDWMADYVQEDKNLLFALQKMQAKILDSVRSVPSEAWQTGL